MLTKSFEVRLMRCTFLAYGRSFCIALAPSSVSSAYWRTSMRHGLGNHKTWLILSSKGAPVLSIYSDDTRKAPHDSEVSHDSCRPDILDSEVLAASTSSLLLVMFAGWSTAISWK